MKWLNPYRLASWLLWFVLAHVGLTTAITMMAGVPLATASVRSMFIMLAAGVVFGIGVMGSHLFMSYLPNRISAWDKSNRTWTHKAPTVGTDAIYTLYKSRLGGVKK